jgi:hypothetical protein
VPTTPDVPSPTEISVDPIAVPMSPPHTGKGRREQTICRTT